MSNESLSESIGKVAVIGMGCRFPGAANVDEYREVLRDGRETITFFEEKEGAEPLPEGSDLVRAYGVCEGTFLFDPEFFGYTVKEGELMDPQHRVFLECAWEALEAAGYGAGLESGRIGVFAGAGHGRHLVKLANEPAIVDSVGMVNLLYANDRDFLATRVGYKLNLKGPCVTVQTASSTSLVAIVLGCQSLLTGQSDIVLAGGVSLDVEGANAYRHDGGRTLSTNGHCRPFDAAANGSVLGSGVGVVVLKRLEDAIADRDTIHAVVIGSAINNDGSAKVGFTAPSVEGQMESAMEAIVMAGIDPESIGYIECHGTATPFGDPIEVSALTRAFHSYTRKKSFCAIGSVKSNFGHTGAAAGVAGFIKTVLSLKHAQLLPTVNLKTPNPEIPWNLSPFFPIGSLTEWKREATPRRAGQNSYGIGGTNAHVLLEEAPALPQAQPGARPCELLVWSARSESAAGAIAANLASHLEQLADDELPDAAFTLQAGRAVFPNRRFLVCRGRDDAIDALLSGDSMRIQSAFSDRRDAPVVFLFPGQGAQFVEMGLELYETESVFREHVDACAEMVRPHLGYDLRSILYPAEENRENAEQQLNQTINTQPALFTTEYALAKLWMQWGITPDCMIGHSVGEFVAACLSGVLSLKDAASLVTARGKLMQGLPRGAMLSVMASEADVAAALAHSANCSIAAINAQGTSVVAGPISEIEALEKMFSERGVTCRRLQTSHAFHSPMMDPILEPFRLLVKDIKLGSPKLPYISNLTGKQITPADVTDPDYWVRHLRNAVRFVDGVETLGGVPGRVLLETGPGRTLSSLISRHSSGANFPAILQSLPRHEPGQESATELLLDAAGKMWLNGVKINWHEFHGAGTRRRIPMPSYPFERRECRIALTGIGKTQESAPQNAGQTQDAVKDCLYYPLWRRTAPLQPAAAPLQQRVSLVFLDSAGLGLEIAQLLAKRGDDVVSVLAGRQFLREGSQSFTIDPAGRENYTALLAELRRMGKAPAHIIHMWSLANSKRSRKELDRVNDLLNRSFQSLIALSQAIAAENSSEPVRLDVIAADIHDVTGAETVSPAASLILGPARAVPFECPRISSRVIDIQMPADPEERSRLAALLLNEFDHVAGEDLVAHRGGHRWRPAFDRLQAESPGLSCTKLRERGVYLISGGLGQMGLEFAEYFANNCHARLALFGRSDFPAREHWERWIADHEQNDSVSAKIRKLQAIESSGAEVMVLTADVSEAGQMKDVVDRIRKRFGAIHGVIHAAGVSGNGLIELTSRAAVERVLAAKVRGTLVLEELLKDQPLDFFALCSSLTAVHGAPGEAVFASANAFLDAFAHSRHSAGNLAPVSINWPRRQPDRGGKPQSAPGVPAKEAFGHVVFSRHRRRENVEVFSGTVSAERNWFIGEHRVNGMPTLVGTTYLELARAALAAISPGPAELRDVVFLTPLMMSETEERELELVLKGEGDEFEFRARSRTEGGDWADHVMGRIGHAPEEAEEEFYDVASFLDSFGADPEQLKSEVPIQSNEGQAVQVGPRWQCLSYVARRENEAIALLKLPEAFVSDLDDFPLHPAIVDCATSFAATWAASQGVYLPYNYERVRARKVMQPEVYCYARYAPSDSGQNEVITLDVDIFSTQGELLAEVTGFSLKRVRETTLQTWDQKSAELSSAASEAPAKAPAASAKSAPKAPSFPESVEILRRVLSFSSIPQVVVTAVEIDRLIAEAREWAEKTRAPLLSSNQPVKPRPELSAPPAEPRSDLERRTAGLWKAAFRVEPVGIHDNFTDLGGTPLQVLVLAATIRRAFNIDFASATIYAKPTIAGLAEVIERIQGGQPESPALATAGSAASLLGGPRIF
jgi:acyl transferase domain-containing protein